MTEARRQDAALQIEVTFDIDANGIVNVSAKDLGTGKEQHITITSGTSMSDDEIERAVKEAAEYEAQDKKRKEAVDAKNEAESFISQTKDALKQVGDNVSADEKSKVENEISALEGFLSTHPEPANYTEADTGELKAKTESLMSSAQAVFAKMYEQTQQAAGGAGAGAGAGAGFNPGDMGGFTQQSAGDASSSNSGAGDDVVDADFKEV